MENPTPITTTKNTVKIPFALILTLILVVALFVIYAIYRIDINPCPQCRGSV